MASRTPSGYHHAQQAELTASWAIPRYVPARSHEMELIPTRRVFSHYQELHSRSGGSFVRWLEWARFVMARDLTLGTVLERLAAVHGDRQLVEEAVGDGGEGERLTYAEAADIVARWAGAIAGRIEPGDRVVIAAPNSYRFLLLCLAASRAGAIAVPVNQKMRPAEVE